MQEYHTVQKKVVLVQAELQRAEQDLKASEQGSDEGCSHLLRNLVVQLRMQLNELRERQNVLLQEEPSGQHCLPCCT